MPPGTSSSPLLQVGPGTKRIKIHILEVVENLLRIVFNYCFEDFLMTRHPREGQEKKMETWFSPGRAEPILPFTPLAAQGWNSMRKGGKVGAKGSGVTEGICPKRWT